MHRKKANWNKCSYLVKKITDIPTSEPTVYIDIILNTIKEAAEVLISKSDGYYKACLVTWSE